MKQTLQHIRHHAKRVVQHRHVQRVGRGLHLLMAGFVGLAALSIIAQLFYPTDRALPFVKVAGQAVGFETKSNIAARLNGVAATAELTIITPAQQRTLQWASAGITIDRQVTAEVAVRYEWWERLVPFSSVVRAVQGQQSVVITRIDKERLATLAQQIAQKDTQPPTEANVSITTGKVSIDEARAGLAFTAAEVERQLLEAPFAPNAKITLHPRFIPLQHGRAEIIAATLEAEQLAARRISIQFTGKTYEPGKDTIGSWLKVNQDALTGRLKVQVDQAELKKYLETLSKAVESPPGTVEVTLVDGIEISRTSALAGQVMDVEAASQKVAAAFMQAAPAVEIPVQTVPPHIVYKKMYSQASSGLQALIEDWEKEHYGDFGIIVREVGGARRYAEWQPDKKFVPSSTYKMFLAYALLTKIEQGEVTSGQLTDIGWTVDDCLVEMIINSTNPCAVSFQNLIGWEEVDRMIHAAGFTETMLNNRAGGQKHTTVRDEANFLLRLNAGSLMNSASTERLLGLMKRQIWRGGVPAGVPRGVTVANKVGFYNGYVHDVAIVYSPSGTYILAIMSRGGSDPVFADLSRKVYTFFNP